MPGTPTETLARHGESSDDSYRSLFDKAPIGYHEIDREGILLSVSRYECGMLGYLPDEMVGRPVWDFVTPRMRQPYREDFQRKISGELPLVLHEGEYLHRDGRLLLVQVYENRIAGPLGVTLGLRSALVDITQQRQHELDLAKKQEELERINAELAQFAYVASHDLQEPLRMVASYTQLLARRYKGRLDADADEFISYAVEGANRMQALINDLLTYSRAGNRSEPRASDPTVALQKALFNLSLAIQESGAVVNHDPLPLVMADPMGLTQLFQNLVGNAIKFRDGAAPRVEVTATLENGMCHFQVRDNGIGIDPRHSERIFQVFQRLGPREQWPGTGIGLAICKKIVERHSGRIWVESEQGKGATFHFTVPGFSGGDV